MEKRNLGKKKEIGKVSWVRTEDSKSACYGLIKERCHSG